MVVFVCQRWANAEPAMHNLISACVAIPLVADLSQ